MISYSASSSVVASWAVGFAERDTDTAAAANGVTIVSNNIAVRVMADELRFIDTPT
jgi:hypothetical protein